MYQVPFRWKQWAGEETYAEGLQLRKKGYVREENSTGSCLRYLVSDDQRWEVRFPDSGMPFCSCEACRKDGICRHIVAAGIAAQESGMLSDLYARKALKAGPSLLDAMASTLPSDTAIHLEPVLQIVPHPGQTVPDIRISLRIGESKLYVVRSIPLLLDCLRLNETLDFGRGFTLHPEWMQFDEPARKLLDLLRCLQEASADPKKTGDAAKNVLLPASFVVQLLPLLTELPFRIVQGSETSSLLRARNAHLNLRFQVSGGLRGLNITAAWPQDLMPLTPDCAWLLISGSVIHVDTVQQRVLLALRDQNINGVCSFAYPYKDSCRVVGDLVPFLKLAGIVEISDELNRMLIRLPLVPRVYIDRDGRDVVARAVFAYGDREINPFTPAEDPQLMMRGEKLLLRNAAAEHHVLEVLGTCGFHVNRGSVRLSGQDAIYDFVTGGVEHLRSVCEVYLSSEFSKLTPRRPALRGFAHMTGMGLDFDFTDDGEPIPEIQGIMDALARRKNYFRLKDGSMIDLTGMEDWQPLAESLTDAAANDGAADPEDSSIHLHSYRACYLANLLEALHLPVEVDSSITETVVRLSHPEDAEAPEMPAGLHLRSYQLRGYQWLRTLDSLHMGGILADDMGLGKTIQVIALLKELRAEGETSLVVAPSSLTYNWLNEINRFAPELSVMVLSGSAPQRQSQLEHVQRARDIDVLITSYPLIRRDIDLMKDIRFRFAILDEAQQIKNAGSVSAAAVRRLQAQTRFALTGTPMENNSGELWSIFDFVLPGYLGSYSAFMKRYQDGTDLDDLRRRIRPFLMRRLKKDVLTELPDKSENILTAQMTPDQEKVYLAAMQRLRDRVNRVMDEKGFGRGRVEILSAITELRQICCHPSLVLDGYSGSSGKLELLMDLLPGLIASGRRTLIFSQFTSMLKLLLRNLQSAGFSCMYLDGDTPPATRVEMTTRFNAGDSQIFLISLKAGGTGLNLTGADVVIHYDPWWNPAAEDQATDRAHRIGQTHKVDVLRLVTHGSIEEKVVELGQRKKALFDQLITPGEELVTALTEQDIRDLFA